MTRQTPYISILIVSWNALETVKKCLPSVVQTEYDSYEIIFVDNASTDGSVAWVEQQFPDVRIVKHPENWAFCKGNNEAVPFAHGEVLVFLNNDVEVPPNWLTPIANKFKTDSTVGAAQPKIMQFNHRDRFEYAGAAGGFIDRDGFPFARGRIFDTLEEDKGQYDLQEDIFWASGTCLAVRAPLFIQLGGFETTFFMHMEEIDLCWRIKTAGYRIVLIPKSKVFHIGGASLAAQSPRKHFLNFRNNLLMLRRNLPSQTWKSVYKRRLFLDSLAALKMLATLNLASARAVFRAHREAKHMAAAVQHMKPAQVLNEMGQNGDAMNRTYLPLPFSGSIVWHYYIRRRMHFTDLPKDKFSH